MIHIDNTPHALQYGITHKNSPNKNPNFITIGDVSLIDTRSNKQVQVDNGDFMNFDAPIITLGAFIPFYFGIKMPMLYVMQHGGNFVEKPTSASNIIYLACSVSEILKKKSNCYFSDGHAIDSLTTFYDFQEIPNLPKILDWQAIKAPYWAGQENLNLKRKKQAEFLSPYDLSPEVIIGFGCYDNSAKKKLIGFGINEENIRVIPNAYY